MGEAAADARGDVEPAVVSFGHINLVQRVQPHHSVVIAAAVGVAAVEIGERAFGVVIKRRVAQPMPRAAQAQIRQALHGFIKIIHARLHQQVQFVVRPFFVQLQK